jgi:LysR family nitrogen assimilation transcriptional regulator
METRRLEYFVRIVDAGSINRAASSLGIAQPALSQQLMILEAELRCRLLVRSPSGVAPTEAGERLYVRAQSLLRQVKDLQDMVAADDSGSAGVVSVGMPPSLSLSFGTPLCERVSQEHGRLRLQMVEASGTALLEQLRRGSLDIALIPVDPLRSDIAAKAVLCEEMMFVAPKSYGTERPALPELAAMPWMLTRSPNTTRGMLTAMFAEAKLELNISLEVESLPVLIDLVCRGYGVTFLPRSAVPPSSRSDVVEWQASDGGVRRTIYLCRRNDRSGSGVAAVCELIEGLAGAHSGQP